MLLGKGDGTFDTVTALGTQGNSIGTADCNGDGKPDILLASFVSPNLYVFFGNGDGTVQTPVITNISTSLTTFVIADVNGDGKPDVLGISAGVFVLLGKTDGTFTIGNTYPALSNSTNLVAVADFNADGKVDIVLAAQSDTSAPGPLGVLLGNGNGTFQPAVFSTGVNHPAGLVAKDFNGDGKLDLAIADVNTNKTFIAVGNGDGTFLAPGSPMPVSGILAAVDLNGDSKTDLVIGSNPFAYVFLGAGNGTFTLKDTYSEAPNNSRQSIAIADFDGDGKPDVASNNTVLLGKGDGSLQGNQAVSLGNALGQGVTGDFNRDGNPDLAAVSANNANNLYILSGNSTGKLTLAHTDTLPLPFDAIATADLRGNGGLDLVFITHDPVTQISILNVMLGNSDGSFASPNTFPQGSVARVSTIAFADFNGDHAPDLAVLSTDGLTVFLGNGDGTFGAPAAFFAGSSPTSFATSDFNGDGVTDVAVASMAGIGILVGKGDGTFKPATFPISVLSNVLSSASADLNGDGKADLVTSNGTNLQVFLGNGDATFAALPPIALPGSKLLNVVDIDGDGKLDLVVSMGLRVLLGNGDGTFSEPLVIVPQESHAGNRFSFDRRSQRRSSPRRRT